MLHRPCNLVKFIRNVTCRYHADQLCIFQIGLVRRHASILIVPKYSTQHNKVHTNSQVFEFTVFANRKIGRHGDCRWICVTKLLSDDAKFNKDKSEAKLAEEVQQRIIELNEEKLGQLKERVLDIEPVVSKEKEEAAKGQAPKFVEKQTTEFKESLKNDVAPKKAKKKVRVDKSTSSLERNFITPVRAMADFLLKPSDLETLPKTKRRSPYELEPPITVYWRKDVEAKALEVWGSKEALLKELLKKEVERKIYQQNVFTVKRRLRDYRREIGSKTEIVQKEGLFGRSGKVVLTAIAINASNFLCKLIAWLYTGSHSMFSECVHSAADTCNQLILAYGIHKSVQNPNPDHPYGYTNMKYVSSLISGVGIFCVGTGLSVYHGIHGLLFPAPLDSFFWAYFVLGGSLLSEGATLMIALHSIKRGAEEKKESLKHFVLEGHDPSVNVVLMEDFAAVLGVIVAVGGLLGGVAAFIINSNVAALIGRSISQENLDKINAVLEADIMVRAIHDVKGIDMGNNLVRYKAEIDFDGRELTRSYLDKHDLNAMLEEVKNMQNIDELEAFLLKHGENIVDMLGGEIDRIELKLKKNHPEIRHCDLEIL
ncbi:zinc transporter 9 isoform X2 [Monomorium pharaonis]|uniref:zinc transporter 9 isoform X2 n=1 Tax=Monomorium pharaonis TaxID=307658 RepID=UPI00102E1382|nr:zinc transporter 9 isoform X2 [Monomorium pharaonis]